MHGFLHFDGTLVNRRASSCILPLFLDVVCILMASGKQTAFIPNIIVTWLLLDLLVPRRSGWCGIGYSWASRKRCFVTLKWSVESATWLHCITWWLCIFFFYLSKWVCAHVGVKVTGVFIKDLLGVGMHDLHQTKCFRLLTNVVSESLDIFKFTSLFMVFFGS